MVTAAEILLGVAALGGIVLAIGHLRGRRPPFALALVHGLVSAIGLVTLIIAMVQGVTDTGILTSLILFIVAALGGFVLFSLRLRNKQMRKGLISIHALVAVVGYVVLLVSVK